MNKNGLYFSEIMNESAGCRDYKAFRRAKRLKISRTKLWIYVRTERTHARNDARTSKLGCLDS